MRTRRHGCAAMLTLILVMMAGCAKPSPAPGATTAPTAAIPTVTSAPAAAPTATRAPTPQPTPTPQATKATTIDPAALAGQVSAERLMADVSWLADDARQGRQVGSPAEDEAGAWLVERFAALGLVAFSELGLTGTVHSFEMPFMLIPGHGGDNGIAHGENIVGVWPGATRPGSYVYVTAHYDGLGLCDAGQPCNGANDDATGVAAVLETARIVAGAGVQPEETVVFIAFSGEEVGLVGSAAFCERLEATGRGTPGLALNLEMLGPARGYGTRVDVWDEERPSTEPLVQAVQQAGQDVGYPVKRLGLDPGSDAVTLNYCGVPAVSVDGAWGDEPHSTAHTTEDDADRIDAPGFERAVQVIVAATWRLANDGQ